MSLAQLMLEGLRLMALGMGIVFGFLVLLVFVMKAMSRFAASFAGHSDIASTQPAVSSAPEDSAPAEVLAAISAAIHHYRSQRRRHP